MIPFSQINIGGDPLLNSPQVNIEEQLRLLDARKQALESLKLNTQASPSSPIWDEIDSELKVLNKEQYQRLFENKEYVEIFQRIQELISAEIVNLVKVRIENTQEGNKLLQEQLKLLRTLKTKIVEDTNREVELFRSFREFSKTNPGITYEEFIKSI
jgi:hypothetical protein